MSQASTVIRWAGSKRLLMPALLQRIPQQMNFYIEPFAGSACLFFHIAPARAILGDINKDLINTYNILQKSPRTLHRAVARIDRTPTEYYRIRQQAPDNLSEFEQAVRFLYLNRNCYNGVYRTNSKGQFNVPMGRKTGALPSADAFEQASRIMREARFVACDYKSVLALASKGDFVYLDPPYTSSRYRGEYGPGAFSAQLEPELLSCLADLDARKINFMLSYTVSDEVLKGASKYWKIENLHVRRHVAGFAKHRILADEIVVRNY